MEEAMTYFEQDELALLLLMSDEQSSIDLIRENGPAVISGLLEEFPPADSWALAPGRSHLPAEIGGRIVEMAPAASAQPRRRGDWLREFDAGYCMTDLEPLQFDRKTLTYTGTILWDIPKHTVSISK